MGVVICTGSAFTIRLPCRLNKFVFMKITRCKSAYHTQSFGQNKISQPLDDKGYLAQEELQLMD